MGDATKNASLFQKNTQEVFNLRTLKHVLSYLICSNYSETCQGDSCSQQAHVEFPVTY